jgi:predicted Holliday junction resolvase-like endonuclease
LQRELLDLATLLITNKSLDEGEIAGLKGLQVAVLDWLEAASVNVADYEAVILDTRLSPLLNAGGVMLVLAGPTVEIMRGRDSQRNYWHETNYDFLPNVFLRYSQLDSSPSRAGSRFDFDPTWSEYFSSVSHYWKIIKGISQEENRLEFDYGYGVNRVTEHVQPVAVTKTTSEIVGCLISWKGGTIGILPPTDELYLSMIFLTKRASDIYKQNMEQTRELLKPPTWISDFKTQAQKRLEKEEDELEEKLEKSRKEIDSLFLATSALFSTGKQLERAITKIFSDLQWKVDDLTKEGRPIDYVVQGQKGTSDGLLIALTGSASYIDANHKKIAQLFGALAEVGEGQRLVFLVNALADEDPRSRMADKCITEPARKRMEKHGICIVLVPDLYRLWQNVLEGKQSADQIFQQIHSASGVLKPP